MTTAIRPPKDEKEAAQRRAEADRIFAQVNDIRREYLIDRAVAYLDAVFGSVVAEAARKTIAEQVANLKEPLVFNDDRAFEANDRLITHVLPKANAGSAPDLPRRGKRELNKIYFPPSPNVTAAYAEMQRTLVKMNIPIKRRAKDFLEVLRLSPKGWVIANNILQRDGGFKQVTDYLLQHGHITATPTTHPGEEEDGEVWTHFKPVPKGTPRLRK